MQDDQLGVRGDMVDDDFDEFDTESQRAVEPTGPTCGVAGDLFRQAVVSLKAKLEQAQPNNMEAEEIKRRLRSVISV